MLVDAARRLPETSRSRQRTPSVNVGRPWRDRTIAAKSLFARVEDALREYSRLKKAVFLAKILLVPIILIPFVGFMMAYDAGGRWWKERPKLAADTWQTFAVPESDLVLSLPGTPERRAVDDPSGFDRITEYHLNRPDVGFEFGVGWLEPVERAYSLADLPRLTGKTRRRLEGEILHLPPYRESPNTDRLDGVVGRPARKVHLTPSDGNPAVILWVFLAEGEQARRAYFVWMSGGGIDPKYGDGARFCQSVSLPRLVTALSPSGGTR